MRIALGIEYEGTHFNGFQTQLNMPTIQSTLEAAISRMANEDIKIFCAGRTDTGVHALNQIIHFDTTAIRETHSWVRGVNTYLPPSIAVQWARVVDDSFHARFSAKARRYFYLIYRQNNRSAILAKRVTALGYDLNVSQMQEAADFLVGEHDFTSFRSSQCQAANAIREIYFLNIIERGKFLILDIMANAFLHHMVRNIVGSLLHVGRGNIIPAEFAAILSAKNRRTAFETAAASGLYLSEVTYPDVYQIPSASLILPF